MEVIRRFYRLPDLAERWGCSVNDLLHAASIGYLPLHVDSAGFDVRTLVRTPTDPQPNALRLRGALFLLDRKVARKLEQPGAFPFKLNIASYWPDRTSTNSWLVEFFPALEISAGHLCVWREHAEQYRKEVNKKEATSDQSLKTVERDSLLKIVLGMATAAQEFRHQFKCLACAGARPAQPRIKDDGFITNHFAAVDAVHAHTSGGSHTHSSCGDARQLRR